MPRRDAADGPGPWRLFISVVADPENRRFILADLDEEFARRCRAHGAAAARRWYRWQARRMVWPGLRARLARRRPRSGAPHPPASADAGAEEAVGNPRARPPGPAASPGRTFDSGRSWNPYVSDVAGEFRFALRTLKKSPLTAAVIVVSLGIGIGAVTTAFTLTNALLLRPPVEIAEPETLVSVYTRSEGGGHGAVSYPDVLDLRELATSLDAVAAFRMGAVTLGDLDEPAGVERLAVEIVTGNYFDVLGVPMALGRGFREDETELGAAERVAVIGHHVWQDRFGGDPAVLGRTLEIDGDSWTVVGVAPEGMTSRLLGMRIDAWLPLGTPGGVYHATPSRLANRAQRDFWVLARMHEPGSLDAVRAELAVLADRLGAEYREDWRDERGRPLTLAVVAEEESRLPPDFRAAIGGVTAMLLGATALVLLIACSNVTSLLLARAHRRRHEMAVRVALGAGRLRLVRLMMVESLLSALAGGVVGIGLAYVAADSLRVVSLPIDLPMAFEFTLDHRVLGFAVLLSFLTCALFGLVPALQDSRPSLLPSLKADAGIGKRYRRFGLRNLLIIGQVAATLVFVFASGLLFRGARRAISSDRGFNADGVAVMSKILPEEEYTAEAGVEHLRQLVARLEALPDVGAAHLSRSVEGSLFASIAQAEVTVPGHETGTGEPRVVTYNAVTPGYLEMLEIRLLRGRTFSERDGPDTAPVAVVNETFVERFWPGTDGLGRRFTLADREAGGGSQRGSPRTFEVVGVVGNGRYHDVEEEEGPFLWIPFYQGYAPFVVVHVAGRTGVDSALRVLWREYRRAPEETTLITPTTFNELIDFQYSIFLLISRALAYGGAFGLALAAIGIYGIVSFAVAERRREMAIRQAIGARRGQVLRLIVGDGLRLALYGLAVGLLLAVPVGLLVDSASYGVSPFDPLAIAGGCAILLAAALAASLVPALRVLKFDPVEMLRAE